MSRAGRRAAAPLRDYWWRREGLPSSLADIVPENARRFPDRVILERREGKVWQPVTAAAFHDEVARLAAGLVMAGVGEGDRVALMADTRYEWTLIDAALWACGAVVVPVYASSSAEQLRWILDDSGASACIFERDDLADLLSDDDVPSIVHTWVIEPGRHGRVTVDEVAAAGAAPPDKVMAELDRRRAALSSLSLATIIYTSGTTGRPKGCELTHGNFLFEVSEAMDALSDLFEDPDASTLLFLPLAHVFGRMIQVAVLLAGIRTGHTDIGRVSRDLPAVRPTFVLAVPRVFERIIEGAQRKAAKAGKAGVFAAALRTAAAYSRALDRGRPGPLLRLRHAVFDRLVYRNVREALGARLRFGISGGASLGPQLGHTFRGMGLTILEGYGLTETTAAATVNTPAAMRIGTVGRPLPGFQVMAADDGEILIRGPHVFAGYWGNPEATEQAFASDRWLRTGDLGSVDADGFLSITGRSKEILVTSTGKNVSPAPLEDVLRSHRLVSQAVVIGDGEPNVSALLTLDAESIQDWLDEQGRPPTTVAALTDDPDLRVQLEVAVDAANATVSAAEQIARFRVLPIDLTIESGHLTPTLKIRRAVVMDDFASDVAALYPKTQRA